MRKCSRCDSNMSIAFDTQALKCFCEESESERNKPNMAICPKCGEVSFLVEDKKK